jgi:hypothetical protein
MLMEQLALAVAGGSSVSKWARENNVLIRTASGWAVTQEFKTLVKDHRRRLVDAAIGRLTKHIGVAVGEIARLVKHGQTDAIR